MLIYGHRGAKGIAPENTLASFQACLEQGVTRCELDLQLSLDKQAIVFHDPDLKRTTGRKGKVASKTVAQLKAYDARFSISKWPVPCAIPTLEELFEHCTFEHWQLEIKNLSHRNATVMVKTIAVLAAKYALEQSVTITSSSLHTLKTAREHAEHIPRGFIAEHHWLDPIKVARRHDCSLLALNWTLCAEQRIRKAQAAGLHVSVWTVNEPHLMRELARYRVDSLITDFPDLAIATLGTH